jgi:hypothetical protein
MIEIVKFKAEHLEKMTEQKAMSYLREHLTTEHFQAAEQSPWAYSIIKDGVTLLCAGVVSHWDGRGEAWAFLNQSCKFDFLAIHRAVSRFLDVCPLNRIDATVDATFDEGHRWVKMLGFDCEAPLMKSYLPGGRDASLYARVR